MFGVTTRNSAFWGGVEEVDVLAMAVVEVVVLARSRVDGRGSRDLGGGSGTCLSLHEFP